MASPVIQFKRGAFANLPGLQAGEPALTTDTYELYVGIDSTTSNNKFFGSHRYWTREGASTGSGVNLVEGTSNGSSFITLKAPDSLSGIVTYTMPATDGSSGHILKTDGNGNLSFSAPAASSFTLAADTGSNDTFNTGETLTFEGGEGVDTTVSNNKITIGAEIASTTNAGVASFTSADFSVTAGGLVSLQTERIQDIAGAMVTGNTETLITVTYQDADGTIDFVVDNDLANYSNTNSAFITASSSDTLTNKTFNANGTGNSLSNVEVADFAASAIVTEAEGLNSSDNDTSLPTTAAVKNYVDSVDLTVSTAGDSGTGSVSTSQTLTVSGTANEIETTASGQSITIGLPNNVSIAGTLTVDRIDVNQISPDGSDFGTTDYVPVANGSGGWQWLPVTSAGAGTLDGISVSNANGTVGTAGSITNIKFTDNLVVTGTAGGNIATVSVSSTPTFTSVVFGSGTAITSVDTDLSTVSATDNSLASAKAIKSYVDAQVTAQDLDITTDSGTIAIDLDSETLTIAGTTNEIETSATGNTVTIGLPNDVTIGNNLTVSGNLYVNGSTTQVNTASLSVEDRTIELGIVNGSAPSATTTWDLGVLFNYYQTSAKKAAVAWEQGDSRFKFASEVSDGGGTNNNSPQITFTAFAPIEIGSLWVTDCAGTSQVISCTGTTRNLENITIDAGTF